MEAGHGPAVLLLHGFPQFWWTWRHQLTALADAGYRAIAMDLRGYGGSDHTPHGYDPATLAADIVGVVRSLGEEPACIVGHGWGGLGAWSVAVLQPSVVRGIVPVDGGAIHVAFGKAYDLTPLEVDGGKNDHGGALHQGADHACGLSPHSRRRPR